MTDTDIAPQLEVLTRRRIDVVAQLDALKESLASIDAAILTLVEPGTALEIDNEPIFRVTVSHRWDEDTAREVLPPELLDAITVTETVTRIDRATAKEVLPPALYTACTKPSKPSVGKVTGR